MTLLQNGGREYQVYTVGRTQVFTVVTDLGVLASNDGLRSPALSAKGGNGTTTGEPEWFGNPKGIVSSSPATVLPSPRGYPGLSSMRFSTQRGFAPCPPPCAVMRKEWGHNPVGVENRTDANPR